MLSSFTRCTLLIALLISLQSSCFAAYLPHPSTSSKIPLDPSSSNTTLTVPDQRFSVTPVYWGPKLRSTACLFIATDTMANLALNDFYGEVVETIFDFDEHPGVVIAVLPVDWHKGGEMDRRFAVWGLYLAVFDMMKRSQWTCNTFHLFWEGKEVGTLGFSRGVVRHSALTADSANSQGLLSLSNVTSTATTLTPSLLSANGSDVLSAPKSLTDEVVLSVNVELKGKIMPINNVFIAVLGALSDLAAIGNKDGRLSAYSYRQAPVKAFLNFATLGYHPLGPPPFLTYRHVIEALAHLPGVMFEQRVFSEADMVLKLDDVDVGMGLLRQLRPLGGGAGGGVATS